MRGYAHNQGTSRRGENKPERSKRRPIRSGVSAFPHLSLASQANERRWLSPPLLFRLPGRLPSFEDRSLAVARAGRPLLFWLAGDSSSRRYITGAKDIAIGIPFSTLFFSISYRAFGEAYVFILEVRMVESFKKT